MFTYRAYGLNCASGTALSGFLPQVTDICLPDIVLEIGSDLPAWLPDTRNLPLRQTTGRPSVHGLASPPPDPAILGLGGYFQLTYCDGTYFAIDSDGSRVWGTWSPPLTIDDFAVYLRGPVMGFILRRRGVTALHASAVCVEGQTVALCGGNSAGKSTTAAALALRGIAVLADDITALSEAGGRFYVEAGYPRVCLWPSAVQDLLGAPDALPRLTPTWDKCFLPLDGVRAKFEPERHPLGAVYLLATREEAANAPRVEDVSPRDALLEIVRNTYMNWLLDKPQRAAEFEALGKLVTQIPVRRIIPHRDPARIQALCDVILEDAERLSGVKASATLVSGT